MAELVTSAAHNGPCVPPIIPDVRGTQVVSLGTLHRSPLSVSVCSKVLFLVFVFGEQDQSGTGAELC